MPFKCPCCPKKDKTLDGMNLNDSEYEDLVEQQAEMERRKKTVRILKEEVYEGVMKKYFATGQDHSNFSSLFFEGNDYKNRIKLKAALNKKEVKNFYQTYLLIDPQSSRLFDLWQLCMLASYLVEMVLIPYTVFVGYETMLHESTWQIEMAIDALHVVNIFVIVCTQTKGDGTGPETDFCKILSTYIPSLIFFVDLVGSIPTLVTLYAYYGLYYIKFLKYMDFSRATQLIRHFIDKLDGTCHIKKNTIQSGQYLLVLMLAMLMVMHLISCAWICIGENVENSWILNPDNGIGADKEPKFKYVTSIYWVMATLTTVGYGDIKGYTSTEYGFTMGVEFVGILVFSIMMGFINEIFVGSDDEDQEEASLEDVDVWLVRLDNSRMSKQLPSVLYEKIKVYISESIRFDHQKLINNFDFLDQLKPSLRFRLINMLFKKPFLNDFSRALFQYENKATGKEFISLFTSRLYCRVFIANQTIMRKGQIFSELYMIFKGSVTLSLDQKDVAEYFRLYRSNYFGDYQIILDHVSSECYKSSIDSPTFTLCLKKNQFLGLLSTFPDAKRIFHERAEKRRIEFRRVKRQFMFEADIAFSKTSEKAQDIAINDKKLVEYGLQTGVDEEQKPIFKPDSKFNTYKYNGMQNEDENEIDSQQPKFLTNPNYYFMKPDEKSVSKDLEEQSDNEKQTKKEKLISEKKNTVKMLRALASLETNMEEINNVLSSVKFNLTKNAEKTVDYLHAINIKEDQEKVPVPSIMNLEEHMHTLKVAISAHKHDPIRTH